MRPTSNGTNWSYCPGLVFLIAVLTSQAGCCDLQTMRVQPKYPTETPGWVDDPFDRRLHQGPFVLRKGESTENVKLGVRVVDVIAAKCSSRFAERPETAKVVLQFYNPATTKVLCEATLDENSNTSIDRPEICKGKVDVAVVGTQDINTHDNWAVFDLRP